jgi:hypothetical protein
MPVATAELLGFTTLGLVLLLVAAMLAGRWLAAGRTSGAKPRETRGDAEAREGFVKKHLRFWPLRRPGQPDRWRPAARPGSYGEATRTPGEDNAELPGTGSVATHSGTGPAAEDQS